MERLVLTAELCVARLSTNPAAAATDAARVRALADELGTPAADAYALVVHGLTDHSPDTVAARVGNARKILAVAHDGTAPELAAAGHFLLLTALLEQGSLRALDIELSPYGETLSLFPELHDSRHARWFRCLRAILDGRMDDAERQADEILAAADDENEVLSRSVWAAQIGTIRWMQGRILEMEPAFLAARHEHPHELIWEFSLAWIWLLQGRESAARAIFDGFTDLDAIPRDRNLLVTLTILGEVAAKIGTRAQAELLREALLPYRAQAVPVGLGLAFWGTVARTIGMLARRLGRTEEARAHFRTAIDVSARNGAQAWLIEAQLELADLDIATGQHLDEAADLARQAWATASALGFPALLARAEASLAALPGTPEPATLRPAVYPVAPPSTGPHVGARHATPGPRVRVLGLFEVISADGDSASWNSRKARTLLKILVARRGVTSSREELMHELWPDVPPAELTNRFAVALSTVRRALDPNRSMPLQHFVTFDGDGIFLDASTVHVDLEEFLTLAQRDDLNSMRRAAALYSGDAFADEPYAPWAESARHDAQVTFCALAHRLARHATASGDHLGASTLYRRILDIEPLDDRAHTGLVDALTALDAHGQARAVTARRQSLLDDLAS